MIIYVYNFSSPLALGHRRSMFDHFSPNQLQDSSTHPCSTQFKKNQKGHLSPLHVVESLPLTHWGQVSNTLSAAWSRCVVATNIDKSFNRNTTSLMRSLPWCLGCFCGAFIWIVFACREIEIIPSLLHCWEASTFRNWLASTDCTARAWLGWDWMF
jgi:hypothetical protein